MKRVLPVAFAISLLGCPPPPNGPEAPSPTPIEPALPAPAPPPPSPVADRSKAYLDVVQDDKPQSATDGATVTIKRAPFALRFPLRPYTDAKPYAVRVVASASGKPNLRVGAGIGADDPVNPCSMGTGLAASEKAGYMGGLTLDEMGHHYLFHAAANDTRVRVLDTLEDGRLEVAFDVKGVANGDDIMPFEQSQLTTLYLGVLMDENLDQRIDPGELFQITLKLE
jgi:hypothetical protein